MLISKIKIENFRLLKETILDFNNKLCMMVGKNNSGKTSFLVLLEKFYYGYSFDFNDFSLSLRDKIDEINESTDVYELSIKLVLEIEYDDEDDLTNISEFILDLDPKNKSVKILFECIINKERILKAFHGLGNMDNKKFIRKNLTQFLDSKIYIFECYDDLKPENRYKLIKKDLSQIKDLVDLQIIHAKREVASSEDNKNRKVLSSLTTKYFNDKNINDLDKFEQINKLIQEMDSNLDGEYKEFFETFLKNAKDFLSLSDLKVISNLGVNDIVNDASQVVYAKDGHSLPEHLNGLGYLNILYLLLSIEIKTSSFIDANKDIKLLFIEEPEAHTHPQLQYIFAKKIDEMLVGIDGLQTIITTHSPHIVSQSKFETIRCLLLTKHSSGCDNIVIKNFYKELSKKYTIEEEFKFLKQYLSVEAAEMFFASKIVFIEGITEKMLFSYFVKKYDDKMIAEEKARKEAGEEIIVEYIPISSQNISVMQVGANAKVFRHFLDFIQIQTLIITDIDTTKKDNKNKYIACAVKDGDTVATSNETIKYFYKAPKVVDTEEFREWLKSIVSLDSECDSKYITVCYQKEENGYHARSFEDAFININFDLIKTYIEQIKGLKNEEKLNSGFPENKDEIYNLTQDIIDKKSDFASSILYLVHTKDDVEIKTPLYIEEGLKWLQANLQ